MSIISAGTEQKIESQRDSADFWQRLASEYCDRKFSRTREFAIWFLRQEAGMSWSMLARAFGIDDKTAKKIHGRAEERLREMFAR